MLLKFATDAAFRARPRFNPTNSPMRYEGTLYRPPQRGAVIHLAGNDRLLVEPLHLLRHVPDEEIPCSGSGRDADDVRAAGAAYGDEVRKVFVADGDALIMDLAQWEAILNTCRETFPRLGRVSAYATAINLNAKSGEELRRLRELGLTMLYIGPETETTRPSNARQGRWLRRPRGGGEAGRRRQAWRFRPFSCSGRAAPSAATSTRRLQRDW